MRILYYDCFAGISGDMNLGALLDLGVAPEKLRQSLSLLGLDDAFELRIERGAKQGVTGTRVVVHLTEEAQPLRTPADIESLIGGSGLPETVKEKSLRVFRALAEAERKAHGYMPDGDGLCQDGSGLCQDGDGLCQDGSGLCQDGSGLCQDGSGLCQDGDGLSQDEAGLCHGEVHFHEVGAVDALVDIVGGVICLEELKPGALWVSTLELGSGSAVCDHGCLPVPAPAVAELVRGFRVRQGGMPFEATTPTGAALLRGLQARSCPQAVFVPERAGYGLGSRDAETPNVLRVWLGEAAEEVDNRVDNKVDNRTGDEISDRTGESGYEICDKTCGGIGNGAGGRAFVTETNIDDMNPEWFVFVEEKLFEAGAADVWRTPIIMKKGRMAAQLSVLAPDAEILRRVRSILLAHTTTLGLRSYVVDKTMVSRRENIVATPFGLVRVKWSWRNGRIYGKPEFDDCRKIAVERGLTLHEVYREIGKHMTIDN